MQKTAKKGLFAQKRPICEDSFQKECDGAKAFWNILVRY